MSTDCIPNLDHWFLLISTSLLQYTIYNINVAEND